MSKTRQEIFDEMLLEKANQASLADLTSSSNTAIWRTWLWLVAFAHEMLYKAWDREKDTLSKIAAQQIIGLDTWYQGLCINWSGGSVPIAAVWVTESLTSLDKKVLIKVAAKTTGATPRYINLSEADLQGLSSFIHAKKILGVDVNVISQTADQLHLKYSIKFTGTQTTVEAAIKAHIKLWLASQPFGATLSLAQLTQSLYSVPGVVDVVLLDALVNIGIGYTSVLLANYITPNAGYWELGLTTSNTDLLDLNMYQ
jgi:hypothetical protein